MVTGRNSSSRFGKLNGEGGGGGGEFSNVHSQ